MIDPIRRPPHIPDPAQAAALFQQLQRLGKFESATPTRAQRPLSRVKEGLKLLSRRLSRLFRRRA